jgi:hypothetical protein
MLGLVISIIGLDVSGFIVFDVETVFVVGTNVLVIGKVVLMVFVCEIGLVVFTGTVGDINGVLVTTIGLVTGVVVDTGFTVVQLSVVFSGARVVSVPIVGRIVENVLFR